MRRRDDDSVQLMIELGLDLASQRRQKLTYDANVGCRRTAKKFVEATKELLELGECRSRRGLRKMGKEFNVGLGGRDKGYIQCRAIVMADGCSSSQSVSKHGHQGARNAFGTYA